MPQLFLGFHLSCALGYLPSLSFLWSYISPHILCGLWGSLRFFIRALVGDDIFGFFCFLVCFAMLNALCWIISVLFLFRLSMSSCSSSAVNLFFSSSWNVFFFVPIIWVSTLVRVFLFRSFLLSALVFSVMEPITSCGSNVDAVYHVGNHARFVSHDVVNFVFSVSIRASPCQSPHGFLLKLCVHDLEMIWCCPFYKSVSSFISLTQAEASYRPFWCVCLSSNFRIKVPHHNCVMCLLFQDLINGVVEVVCLFIWVRCRWRIYLNDLQLV